TSRLKSRSRVMTATSSGRERALPAAASRPEDDCHGSESLPPFASARALLGRTGEVGRGPAPRIQFGGPAPKRQAVHLSLYRGHPPATRPSRATLKGSFAGTWLRLQHEGDGEQARASEMVGVTTSSVGRKGEAAALTADMEGRARQPRGDR